MIVTWQAAARAAVNQIFSLFRVHYQASARTVSELRGALNVYIENCFPNEAPPLRDVYVWEKMGALSLAAGMHQKVLNISELAALEEELVETLIRKQKDYGPENIARFGHTGLTVRFHDKVARVENLIAKGTAPENESIYDNFLDLVGYAAIGVMWSTGEFLLPME